MKLSTTFHVNDSVKNHECFRYTTGIDALEKILKNKTFRCTCLASGKLNDKKESERNGVSDYADGKFIVCFSHDIHESVPFWLNYGGAPTQKVQLVFGNFMKDDPSQYFDTELASTETGEIIIGEEAYKLYYFPDGPEEKTPDGYVAHAYIWKIECFDVEYLPVDNETFSRSYLERVDLRALNIALGNAEVAFPDCLGKQKTDPWEYEKETRILCTTHPITGKRWWDWIDLHVKDEIFREMKIILSPWDDGTQRRIIEKALHYSSISDEIQNTIKIVDSGLRGSLHF